MIDYEAPGTALDDGYEYGVEVAGIGLIDVEITTPWGQTVAVNEFVPADWYDVLYLSLDETVSGDDVQMLSHGVWEQTPLGAEASYMIERVVQIPNVGTGGYYLLFVADVWDGLPEEDEGNNVLPRPIEIKGPDLTVTSVTPGASAYEWGQDVAIDWVVQNIDNGAAVAHWSDRVYLSTDTTLDGSDLSLTFATPLTPLAAGDSYTQSHTVATHLTWNLPEGDYYIIVGTDALNQQPETNEANNVRASLSITMTLPLLPDLVVTNVDWLGGDIVDGADTTLRANFQFSIDLITYGTGNYSVKIAAIEGVLTASELLIMTVIEECNFTLETDQEVYLRGQPVQIIGNITRLTGEPVSATKVEIIISKGGSMFPEMELLRTFFDPTSRKFTTYTDSDGNIDFTFHPAWGDTGLFSVDATTDELTVDTTM